MSITPSSVGSVTFTPVVAGNPTNAADVNTPFQTLIDRANSLTADIATVFSATNSVTSASINQQSNLDGVVTRLGGASSGVWPNRTYSFASETVTQMKVSRDVFYFYSDSIATTTVQPRFRMSVARTLIKSKIRYFRDNTTVLTENTVLTVKKNGTTIGTITIAATDAAQTWIDVSTGFPGADAVYEFAANDELQIVPTSVPTSNAPKDITILFPFEEKVRNV